ncbi:unnamed protein product [Diatraea saccharalis]|uniref:Uncharacterized protein n=1 Tax=Diatraea saccharalis TaxID=40085 RepID=A0A9N9WBL9_9NEOP|nr:unnamed protein product [Diatraea saccharalis]
MAFLCVQKCIDLGYDVAHADKKCVCTCYRNSVKAKYTSKKTNVTKWRHGAPTTKLPIWAQTKNLESVESITNDNYEYFGENQSDNTTKLNDLSISENGTEVAGDNVAGINGTGTVSNNTAEGGGGESPVEGDTPAEAATLAENEQTADGQTANNENAAPDTTVDKPKEEN